MTAIRKAFYFTQERAGRCGHPFIFKGSNNIGVFPVTILFKGLISNLAKTRGKNNCPDMESLFLRFLLKIDGVTLTDRHTDLTSVMLHMHTGTWIDIVGCRNSLSIIDMNGPGDG